MKTVSISCPFCQQQQTIEAPDHQCLAFIKCQHCGKLIKASPKKGVCTCVICEFSDDKCPVEEKA